MKRILFFLTKKQFREIIIRESDAKYKFITYILVVSISSFCIGYFLASYYDFNYREEIVNVDKFLLFVNTFFALNYLLLDFYPVYKVNPFFFPNYYPLGKYLKAFVSLVIYSISYYSLFVLLVYIQFSLFSNNIGIIEVLFCLLFISCGYLINRAVKNITEYDVPNSKLILTVLSILIGGYCWYLYQYPANTLLGYVILIIFSSSLFLCFVHSESEKRVKIKSNLNLFKPANNFYLNLLLNSNLSSTYLYGFLFKILWLLTAGLNLMSENRPEEISAVTRQFASPLIILLYTGLNFFGYSKNLLFTHLIREEETQNLIIIYFKTMGILLLIDGLIFGLFISLTGLIYWENILFYSTSAIVLTIISFWFALYRPQFTDSFLLFDFSFFKNRSKDFNPWGVSVLIIVSFIIDRLRDSDIMFPVSLALILTFTMSLYFYRIRVSSISKYAYQKLRNT